MQTRYHLLLMFQHFFKKSQAKRVESDAKKKLGTIWEKYVSYKDGICFIFLAIFLPLIGRVARYTPSSSEKNSSKI